MNPSRSKLRRRNLAANPSGGSPEKSELIEGVHYRVTEAGCWEWALSRDAQGYGHIAGGPVAGETRAHRASYALVNGPVPKGDHIHHCCENPPCIRPDHLEHHTHSAHLTLHKQADSALSWDDVRAIRAEAWEGESVQVLAERWGLSLGTIHPLIVGRTWKDPEYTRPTWTKECRECGNPFETHRPGKDFCCKEHRYRFNNRENWRRRAAA